jgi:hypothetical protein
MDTLYHDENDLGVCECFKLANFMDIACPIFNLIFSLPCGGKLNILSFSVSFFKTKTKKSGEKKNVKKD